MRGIRLAAVLLLSALPAMLEAQSAGTVQLGSANYVFREGDGLVTLTLTRTGGSSGIASVYFVHTGGTASNGAVDGTEDFYFPPPCVGIPCPPYTWPNGDTSPRTINFIVRDDTRSEAPETVLLELEEPQGATIGTPSRAMITILDNDPALTIPTLGDSGKLLLFCLFGVAGTLLLRRQKKQL